MAYFSTDVLKAAATQQTDLSDFGNGNFSEDFQRFVDALNETQGLVEARVGQCEAYLVRLLKNRLWFEKDLADHPEILEEPLVPAVAIASLPRAGTTKLQRILRLTDQFQNLLYWHTYGFARIPGEPNAGAATRIQQAKDYLEWYESTVPGIFSMHPQAAEDVDEEFIMVEASFRSQYLGSVFPAHSYSYWLSQASMNPQYDYMYRQFQYIQWQFPENRDKPWLLKSPGLLGFEDQLERLFPKGLKIISPHRNPNHVIPSGARTQELMSQVFSEPGEREALGQGILAWFQGAMSNYLNWREQNKTVEVLDLSFSEITADSLETARKVCDFLDIPLTQEIAERIKQWDEDNPRRKHGANPATLEMYGLEQAQVEAAFEPYTQQFGDYF